MVLILGDVGEVREIAVGTNDLVRAPPRETVERGFKLTACGLVLVPVEADGSLTDTLDDREYRLAFLLPDRIAEKASQKADIVAQGKVLGRSSVRAEDGQGTAPSG